MLNPEPSAEELKNTDGLVLVQRVEGKLKLHVGKGLRRLRLAKGETVVPEQCALRPAPRISTYEASGVLSSIERIGERCYELALLSSSAPAHAHAEAKDPHMLDNGLSDGGDAHAPWIPPTPGGLQRITLCVKLPLPFQVGDKMYIAGDAASGVSIGSGTTTLALRWSQGGDDLTPGSCPQVRDACGAVWVTEEGDVPSTLFPFSRQHRDLPADAEGVHIVNTYRVLLGREGCPAHLITPNRRAEWIELSY